MAHRETMSLSVQRSDARASPLQLEFELTKALARVLSACERERTIVELQKSLRIEQTSLTRFVGFLNMNGFLEKRSVRGQDAFISTDLGTRVLEAFVTLYRAAGEPSPSERRMTVARSQYAPCEYCGTHMQYPFTPPITLHVGTECQLCHHTSGR